MIESSYIECLFKRKHINNPKVNNLLTGLELHILEANIIILAIKHFSEKRFTYFDSVVGDRKCQTRASMIIDLADDATFINNELKLEIKSAQNIIKKTQSLIEEITSYDQPKLQKLSEELQQATLNDYLYKNNLIQSTSEKTKLISLCFFTTPISQLYFKNFMSSNKLNKLTILAKKKLCELSINYEKKLAKQYSSNDEIKSLEQIETKGICSMTSFYQSFKSIFEKIKIKKQFILKNIKEFCQCGGIKNTTINLLQYDNNQFNEKPIISAKQNACIVFEGYRFDGSLSLLKKILNVPEEEAYIPPKFYKSCFCKKPLKSKKSFICIEEAIMAFFAKHSQFTTEKEIDFDSLKLQNSKMHKNYKYLKQLTGYCKDDMSKLFIDHIYPSTIKDALQSELPPYNPEQSAMQHIPVIQTDKPVEKSV